METRPLTKAYPVLGPSLLILFKLSKSKKTIYDLAVELRTVTSSSTIYYNVRKLQALGLVIENDGYIELTEKGKALIDMVRKMICEG